MADLTISLDLGSLMNKAIFTLKPFKPELMLMHSEVANATKKNMEVECEQNSSSSLRPENFAWIEYEGKYRAIGFFARERFDGDLNLEEPKFTLALYKTLAIMGAIAKKKGLPNGATVRLGCMLPVGEYEDRKLFEQMITEALVSFRFQGEEKSFELESYVCHPEGFGLLSRGRKPGSSLRERMVVVIMIGYRDASVFIMNRGIMTKGITKELGFSKFIEIVTRQAPGQKNIVKLVEAVCKAGPQISVEAIAHLSRFTEAGLKKKEISRLAAAIAIAREQYWLTLSSWLRKRIPSEADEVIIGGGTAYFYQQEFNALVPSRVANWATGLEEQVNRCFPVEIAENDLSFRLTDDYGYFYYVYGTGSEPGLDLAKVAKASHLSLGR